MTTVCERVLHIGTLRACFEPGGQIQVNNHSTIPYREPLPEEIAADLASKIDRELHDLMAGGGDIELHVESAFSYIEQLAQFDPEEAKAHLDAMYPLATEHRTPLFTRQIDYYHAKLANDTAGLREIAPTLGIPADEEIPLQGLAQILFHEGNAIPAIQLKCFTSWDAGWAHLIAAILPVPAEEPSIP